MSHVLGKKKLKNRDFQPETIDIAAITENIIGGFLSYDSDKAIVSNL